MDKGKDIREKDSHPQIELHSREISDLLGDAPAWLIHTGSYLLYGVLAVLILCAAFIDYPEVVRGSVFIEDQANVKWVTAHADGQIDKLFVDNNSAVKPGDTIAVFQNPAQFGDVRKFCRILANVERYYQTNNTELLRAFPFDLLMGEMTGAYETFTKAVMNCLIYDDYNHIPQRSAFLEKELAVLKREAGKNELAILKTEREIFELSHSHKMEVEKNREQLEVAYEEMVNSLKGWESKYLLRSPGEGRVFLGDGQELAREFNRGDTLCAVISNNREEYAARMHLEQEQVAGIEPGNPVHINLAKYPSHSHGILIGEVTSIVFVPHNNLYAVEVRFPNQLNTTIRKEIKYELGLRGEAEIITSSRSVLSRIFAPVYNLFKTTGNKKSMK